MKETSLYRPFNATLAALLILVSLTGCLGSQSEKQIVKASVSDAPDWVISPPRDNSHLYGVGSAPRIDNIALAFSQAEQNGNAQIAQQLRTQVSQLNTQNTQVSSTTNQVEQVIRVQSAYTQVKTASIELKQTVNEQRFAGDDYVYVLQSINRQRIVTKLTADIENIDNTINDHSARLQVMPDGLAQVQDWKIYMNLIPLFAQRQSYLEELSLYATQDTSASNPTQKIKKVEAQLNQALSQFGFDVTQTQQSALIASELSKYGLTAKHDGVFTLSSTSSIHTQAQQSRYYAFEEGNISLIGPDGTNLASWNISARGIDQDKNRSENKASQAWASNAINSVFIWLTSQGT